MLSSSMNLLGRAPRWRSLAALRRSTVLERSVGRLRGVGRHHGSALRLEPFSKDGEHVIEGVLWTVDCDEWYPIIAGVPCFLSEALQPDLGEFEARHRLPTREKGIDVATEVTRTVATF